MDVREKLVELLQDGDNPVWGWFPNNATMIQLADYLIDNGVTVQECIGFDGKWIVKGQEVFCSNCNKESGYNAWGASAFSDYCPNCGKKMMSHRRKENDDISV